MAGDLELRFDGLDDIIAAYGRVGSVVEREGKRAMERTLGAAIQALSTYPVPRPGQRYVRTGRLGRGWTTGAPRFRVGGNTVQAVFRNPTPYGEFVQGVRQARAHRGRWLTIAIAQDRMSTIYGPLYVNDAHGAIAREMEG